MLIGISGMISSGKSTLSKKLIRYYGNEALLLDEFKNEDKVFNKMLTWFYEKTPNLNISFQAYIVEKHINEVTNIINEFNKLKLDHKKNFIFLDRFGAEHYVFAKTILEVLPSKILKAYDGIFNTLISKKEFPEFAVFLDVSFENFKERLFKRGREVEIKNWKENEEYFKKLHATYKKTFIEVVNRYKIDYAIIDTNYLTEKEVFDKAIELIENYRKEKYDN